jgi:hypothetical protein
MSTKLRYVVGEASISDEPPTKKFRKLSQVQTLVFYVHDFGYRMEQRGESLVSPPLQAHGHTWCLQIFPRGDNQSTIDQEGTDPMVSLFLLHQDRRSIRAQVSFYIDPGLYKFVPMRTFDVKDAVGFSDFELHDYINRLYYKATIIPIQVTIEIDDEFEQVWYPEKIVSESTLNALFFSSDGWDGIFVVAEKEFLVHRFVLRQHCQALDDLLEHCSKDGGDNDNQPVVCLPDIDSNTFDTILRYIYTVEEPLYVKNYLDRASLMLKAANRFGVMKLKLLVESEIVSKMLLASNAVSLMFFADSNTCALLKEAAFRKYVEDAKQVRESKDWPMIKESPDLLDELLEYTTMIMSNNLTNNDKIGEKLVVENLTVGGLRDRLQQVRLEVDGTRRTLVKRLREHLDKKQDAKYETKAD